MIKTIDDLSPEDRKIVEDHMKSTKEFTLQFMQIPAGPIYNALGSALKYSERKHEGCGEVEFTVDGFALYDRIKAIRDSIG